MDKTKRQISPSQVNSIIVQNLPQIVDALELNLRDGNGRLTGCCPVHLGDSPKAFTIYKDDGRWFCWSRHCEEDVGHNMIQLICHLKQWKYHEAIKWLEQFHYDPTYVVRSEIKAEVKHDKTRVDIRKELQIPAKYYLTKGFDRNLLNDYDIGYCSNPNHAMFGRVVFPIYNISGEFVGYTGRTIYPISNKNPKWQHYQIKTSNHLYNLNRAYEAIQKTQTIILVESCANTLRLVQNGIENCVGTFGAHLTRNQEILIECTPAQKIVVLFDPDDAGKKAAKRIMTKYGGKYNVSIPNTDFLHDDIGAATDDEIQQVKGLL